MYCQRNRCLPLFCSKYLTTRKRRKITALLRMFVIISSFATITYVLQYLSVSQQTYILPSKNVVDHSIRNKDEAYTIRHRKNVVEPDKRNDKIASDNLSEKTYFAMNDTAAQQKPISSKLLSTKIVNTNFHKQYKTASTVDVKINDTFGIVYKQFFADNRNVEKINCFRIFNRNDTELIRADYLSNITNVQNVNAYRYRNMTKNCETFIKGRGYITSPLTEEEGYFPIAYSILMYKYVEQMERLLRAIYRPQNVYCIHVDAKTDDEIYSAVRGIANCFENVYVTSKRINVKWGNMTVLEPELLCMKELWTRKKTWKYFINLTGQEFPLRTNFELVKILKAYNGSNDVETTKKRNRDRWSRAPPPPYGIIPTKGAVHVAVSRGFVDYVLHDNRARDILEWVNKTLIPDETFFTTLNHNPKLGVPGSYKGFPESTPLLNKTKPYLARFKNRLYSDVHKWPCHGKWIRQICIFNIGDLPLLAQRKELFANKFHLDYAPYAYGCMEELIFNRTRDEYLGKLSFDASWYASLGFVKNRIE